MSKMYPREFPSWNQSDAEREVFKYFKECGPDDWYVLHSFRLPEHYKVVFGESDFIIVAPEIGVIVLEIKGGGVGFDGVCWYYMDRNHHITPKQRGPFEQARDGLFEVEKIIVGKLGEEFKRTKILFCYGVIFTDEDSFDVTKMTEDKPWCLIQNNVAKNYTKFIKDLAMNFRRELSELGKKQPARINADDAKKIVLTLRPEIELVIPVKSFIEASERDVIKLTEEQFVCIDDIEENDRIVVLGGAGTGKTVLACRSALLEADKGLHIGVFCYSANLARVLKKNLPQKSNIEVSSFHSFLWNSAGMEKEILSEGINKREFYEKKLPHAALEILSKEVPRFDVIIVDEFQDLCCDDYLRVFNVILKGGLYEGRFAFFGDFAQQAIFNNTASLSVLDNYSAYAKKRLSINCRNTKRIGNELINVTGFDEKKYLLKIDGEPVEYFECSNKEDSWRNIKEILKQLRTKKIPSEKIVILSPKVRSKSIVGEYDPEKVIIGDYEKDKPDAFYALFSTIQSFKGLESEVIILCDIDDYDSNNLMYVAFSRARSKMYVLESTHAAKQRKTKLIRR